jgi:hypothetical protein
VISVEKSRNTALFSTGEADDRVRLAAVRAVDGAGGLSGEGFASGLAPPLSMRIEVDDRAHEQPETLAEYTTLQAMSPPARS